MVRPAHSARRHPRQVAHKTECARMVDVGIVLALIFLAAQLGAAIARLMDG